MSEEMFQSSPDLVVGRYSRTSRRPADSERLFQSSPDLVVGRYIRRFAEADDEHFVVSILARLGSRAL